MCYISHKMEEIKQIADRVVVLRDGRTIGDVTPIGDITLEQIIARMVGRDISDMFPGSARRRGEMILEVRNLEVDHPDLPGEKRIKNDVVLGLSRRNPRHFRIDGLGANRTRLRYLRRLPGRDAR